MLRQYHTPDEVITREPTQEELEFEFDMERQSPIFQRQVKVLAELTGKTSEEVENIMKKHYKG